MHDAHVWEFKRRQLIIDIMIAGFPIWLAARERAIDRQLRGFA
ncbi:hypothetical protein SAMN05216588_102411 [Pseudomonas flavescens]|uniref:Uncharacterized protein n=1 Tax=Phytopseudomonas flavescens TaxID=29435 RepID=A0A1G7ZN68_9GAMM|nr:hypothetical protein [Pseudomonas flavescens]SDH10075.1 hypothetical protein SAMN05216588_102411 [Pseudomonas flavescens]